MSANRSNHLAAAARLSRRGFTLVEILAVVVIIGIASAIIIPNMGTRDDLRVSSAARVIVADLIYAQNQAISSSSVVYAKFDVANNRYTLLSTANSGGDVTLTNPFTQQPYRQQFGTGSQGWDTVSLQSTTFNGLDASYQNCFTIAFDEIGSPFAFNYSTNLTNDLSAGSVVVTCGTQTKTITISAATGELTVSPN